MKNLGTLTTTYAVTVTLPNGPQSFNVPVNPGAAVTYTYALSNSVTGLINVNAQATAIGPDVELAGLSASATTRLNVLERFVQLTAVEPNPAFVETGISSTTVKIEVNNLANIPIDTTALITITSPRGSMAYSATHPLRLMGSVQPYDLASITTSPEASTRCKASSGVTPVRSTVLAPETASRQQRRSRSMSPRPAASNGSPRYLPPARARPLDGTSFAHAPSR